MPASRPDPWYDRGYRDGWHDVRVSGERHRKKRLSQRRKNSEYALGYDHGFVDGEGQGWDWQPGVWGKMPKDKAASPST